MGAHPPLECYSIVKTYDILYFAFLAPYKIHYRHESKMFELFQRGKRSQVTVLLIYFLCFVPYFLTFVIRLVNEQRREFKFLFDNYSWLLWSLHLLNFFRILWTTGEAVTCILNLMTQNRLNAAGYSCYTTSAMTITKVRLVQFAITAIAFCWTLVDVRLNMSNFLSSDFIPGFCRHVRYLERVWKLEDSNVTVNNCTFDELIENVPGTHMGFSVFMLAGYMVSELLGRLMEVFCLSYVISFYWITKKFQYLCVEYGRLQKRDFLPEQPQASSIKRTSSPSAFSHLVLAFFGISHIADAMNKAVGSIFTGVCFVTLPVYAVKLESLVEKGLQNWSAAQCFMYAIFLPCVLLTAAAGHSQLKSFSSWLQKVHSPKSEGTEAASQSRGSTVQLVLTELERNQLGIQGTGFTITYGFVGNILSLIVTYAVVILQIQMPALK